MKLPYVSQEIPGLGGVIRQEPADFAVTEVPAYEPCGTGEHLYLWIEKTDVGPEYLLKLLSRKLNVSDRDIGVAGLKDRHAVTRQWVSVPGCAEPLLDAVTGDGLVLRNVSRHTNKLRTGHLKGNRFEIVLRDVPNNDESRSRLGAIVDVIRLRGLPNFYGEQRFGRDADTHLTGFQMLRGGRTGRIPPFRRKLFLSAVQSFLFNDWLARRMNDGLFQTVLPGEVMMKWPAGGLFVAEDVAVEQARFDARETVLGGPMFGTAMYAAKADAQEREAIVLRDHNLALESFTGFGKLLSGTRRHSQVHIEDLSAEWFDSGVKLTFTLPAGSYATVLLREVMKISSM
jgi:tRNA pseudouridine13 synthase